MSIAFGCGARVVMLGGIVAFAAGCSGAAGTTPPAEATGAGAGVNGEDAGGAQVGAEGGGGTGAGAGPGGGGSAGPGADAGAGAGSADGGAESGSPSAADSGAVWSPTSAQPIHFHWQLSDSFSSSDLLSGSGQVVYDIDGQNATAADVATIHAAGAVAVCYVDVGTLEQGRPDYSQFPASVVGPTVQGWPGENWLLVTAANQSVILPLMKARFESWCEAKGFDAIEPDNLDAFTNISGLTQADNLAYDLAIAGLAHALPLSIGLKNLLPDVDASYVPSILSSFDWALVEQCYEYTECDVYSQARSFLPLGKAVWDVEYNVTPACSQADSSHMNAQLRDLDLVAPGSNGYTYTPCIADSQASW